MPNLSRQLHWFAWIASGESLSIRWADPPRSGERAIALVFQSAHESSSDITEKIGELLRADCSESAFSNEAVGEHARSRVNSLGIGDTFCFIRHTGARSAQAPKAFAYLVYKPCGQIVCIAAPNPLVEDDGVIEADLGRYVMRVDVDDLGDFPEVRLLASFASAAVMQGAAKHISERFTIDVRSRRLLRSE